MVEEPGTNDTPTTDEPGSNDTLTLMNQVPMTHLLLMKNSSSLLTQKKRKQEHT
jgi:hypothetical protein